MMYETPVRRRPGRVILRFLVSAVLTVISLALTAAILLELLLACGGKTTAKPSGSLGLTERFRVAMNNQLSNALDGVVVVEKTYMIVADDPVATYSTYAPDRDRFGTAQSPKELEGVIASAKDLLDGETLLFSADTPIMEDSVIHYYADDTILTITWKQVIDSAVYTFTEVKIIHPTQFRRFLSGGEFGSGQLSLASEMAATVNAVAAGSGDFYEYRGQGIVVVDGEAKRANPCGLDVCFIDRDGNMIPEDGRRFTELSVLQQYVDEHNISFSLSFGPMLVKDGQKCDFTGYYPIGEGAKNYSRAALCQMGKLHYLMVTANMESVYYYPPNLWQLGDALYATGCTQAYTLDGGQTATMVVNNEVVNNVNYGAERLMSDIYYFATAMPSGG